MSELKVSETRTHEIPYLPAFIDLRQKPVVVIGGGTVAEREVETLIEAQAEIRLIAPETTPRLQSLASEGALVWLKRRYRHGDLAGARLAFCACGDTEIDELVVAEAEEERCLVNVVDVPQLCDFIMPSVARRGPLRIAISTAGAAPTVAKAIKERLESLYPPYWAAYIDTLGQVRELVRERVRGGESLRKPLSGKKILATRSRTRASALTLKLEDLGAFVYEFPTIAIKPIEDTSALDEAIERLESYQWVVFTSTNGAQCPSRHASRGWDICRCYCSVSYR